MLLDLEKAEINKETCWVSFLSASSIIYGANWHQVFLSIKYANQ